MPLGWRWATTTRSNMPRGQAGQAVHAGRQLLPRRLRRLVPQPLLAGLRLLAALAECARGPRRPARRRRQAAATDGDQVTPDGYAVNTMQSDQPAARRPSITDTTQLLPEQTCRPSATELNEKGIAWAWYSGGWNDARRRPSRHALPVPPPAVRLLRQLRRRHAGRAEHLKDESDFMAQAIADGTLPPVTFYQADRRRQPASGLCRRARRPAHRGRLQAIETSPYLERHGRSSSPTTRTAVTGTTSPRRRSTAGDRAHACRRSSSRRSPRRAIVDHTVIRHDLDPEADRDALRPRAARHARPRRRRPDERTRLRRVSGPAEGRKANRRARFGSRRSLLSAFIGDWR